MDRLWRLLRAWSQECSVGILRGQILEELVRHGSESLSVAGLVKRFELTFRGCEVSQPIELVEGTGHSSMSFSVPAFLVKVILQRNLATLFSHMSVLRLSSLNLLFEHFTLSDSLGAQL